MFLVGDLGGTKTILALVTEAAGPRAPLVEQRYPSHHYRRLEDMVAVFLQEQAHHLAMAPLQAAALGVAGPITHHRATITNLNWVVERDSLAATLGLPPQRVRLLNDLEAAATAIPQLQAQDVHLLNAGQAVAGAPMAVIAPGTGLGEGFLTWDGAAYRAHASEGGHADFAPGDRLQLALLNFLYQEYQHVSVERVCSGIGIPNIYRFLRETGQAEEPAGLREALAQASDATPIILQHALDPAAAIPICRQTLEMFLSILGAEAGNLAIKLWARGGVYLAGGIPPRLLPALTGPHFMQAFTSKGRFAAAMRQIPVAVVLHPQAGLLGAGYAAIQAGFL